MSSIVSTPASGRPSISVAVPVYKCCGCLEQLCIRLDRVLKTLTDRYEIILVDDRSPDKAWEMIRSLQAAHPALRGIRLSRNFGQQVAITAGIAAAKGDLVVVMDCDLQDPPEMIVDLYEKLHEGYDLVVSRRIQRAHSPFRVLAAKAYFALLGRLSKERIDGSYGSFSLLTRKVVDAYLRFSERERHYIFVLRWLGFRMGSIDYEHRERAAGKSSYSLGALIRHAFDGIFFQSTALLRAIVALGLLFALAGMILAAYLIARQILVGSVPGWTSLAVLILTSTGVILISLGVVGLYIGKIFDQVKARPLYIIDTDSERTDGW